PFTPLEGSPYEFRIGGIQDALVVRERSYSVAIVEIRRGEEQFVRWVFDDPALVRDLPTEADAMGHETARPLDRGIEMAYRPGRRLAPVLVIGGPDDDDLGLLLTLPGRDPVLREIEVGRTETVDEGITLTVTRLEPRTRPVTRPRIVPRARRDRDARELFSMVRVSGDGVDPTWVHYHHYAFRDPNETLRRHNYQPSMLEVPGVGRVEMLLSRQRRPLPTPVVLDEFRLETHPGGFTGSAVSILDWTSLVRFGEGGRWSDAQPVSVNDPIENSGFWFFQAQWDPPTAPRFEGDVGSAGLNYTVLGVGNRRGVLVQLVGCIVAVLGMIYAFYVKPIIKRRRRQHVLEELASASSARPADESQRPLVGAGTEMQP
ncbi:MAG: hypothetical protein ACYTGC_04805, partial [Planctomycetota bacterium]